MSANQHEDGQFDQQQPQGYHYAPPGWAPPAVPPGHFPPTGMTSQPTVPPAAQETMTLAPPGPAVRPSSSGRARMLIAASALSAVIGAGAGVGGYAVMAAQHPVAEVAVSTANAPSTVTLDGTIAAAAAKITPSVVTITVTGAQSGDIGTGVIIDTAGHVLTNNHVVSSGQNGQIKVTLDDGTTVPATIVGTASTTDLAVLKLGGTIDVSKLTPATFAASSRVKVGQAVVAVGAPLGLSDTVTSGIVSAVARPVRSGTDDNAVYQAVQTDTPINPGNSGGPLVNLNGQVIGINSSIATVSQSSTDQSGNIGIGFAIPSDVVTRVSANLISTGKSADATLGVRLQLGGSLLTETTSEGVALASVQVGTPAAAAGLQNGDVITHFGQFRVTTSDGLIAAVRYYAPGTKVQLTYLRGGSEHTAQVTLN